MEMQQDNSQVEDYIYQLTASADQEGAGNPLCFAARASGLFCSDNGGLHWRSAYDSLNLQSPIPTMAVAIPPDFEHDPLVLAGVGGGILRSIDRGQTWETIPLPPPPPIVSTLIFSPDYVQDGIIFAGTMEDGVLFSSDRGHSFASWNFGLLDLNILCLAISPNFAEDEILYAGTQSGIFRSSNGGRAWRDIELPFGFEAVISLVLSPNFKKDRTIYAGTETKGLWRTPDGGKTWEQLGQDSILDPINAILLCPEYPTKSELMVLHGGEVLSSVDDGKTWKEWKPELLSENSVTAILAPQGIGVGYPVLVGLENGKIIQVK